MLHNLSEENSIVNQFVSEIRDVSIQQDRLRFRRNMERIGEVAAYEISKHLSWKNIEVQTPLGIAECKILESQPVLATILRAGLVLHNGLMNYFDKADNAFIGAYRKHNENGSFDIYMGYVTCPPLQDRVLIVSDPMLATGASLILAIEELKKIGEPQEIHIVTAIASTQGVQQIEQSIPGVHIWAAAVDKQLTDKAYIDPGLGDAGDLAFGQKLQS